MNTHLLTIVTSLCLCIMALAMEHILGVNPAYVAIGAVSACIAGLINGYD